LNVSAQIGAQRKESDMKRFARLALVPLAVTLTSSAINLSPAVADEKGASSQSDSMVKILLENDKVQVRQATYKPGQVRPAVAEGSRVIHVIKGGTLLRIYPDGTTKEIVFKTGEVKWLDETTGSTTSYSLKNVGNTEVVLFAVILK
jgi:hypothetical protein